jgi:hypothetical protein
MALSWLSTAEWRRSECETTACTPRTATRWGFFVDGMDYFLLDADGRIAEVTIWWRPLPAGVAMQGDLAGLLGMQPWRLLTDAD